MADKQKQRRLIFVSGLSGAGKSVVLHTLEDLDYYCIDNLPISLLDQLSSQIDNFPEYIAVGIDARNIKTDLASIPDSIQKFKKKGINPEVVFLDANEEVITKRFSETRRKHPLSSDNTSLAEAIKLEKQILSSLAETADLRIDTSYNTVHDLRRLVLEHVANREPSLSIQLLSFGYKHGSPHDADFMFDLRCLPNPYWEKNLRQYSGKDQPIIDFLNDQPLVLQMLDHLSAFLQEWLPRFEAENRSYLTIAIGCTGGRHRSVFMVDKLASHLGQLGKNIIVRHRDL